MKGSSDAWEEFRHVLDEDKSPYQYIKFIDLNLISDDKPNWEYEIIDFENTYKWIVSFI